MRIHSAAVLTLALTLAGGASAPARGAGPWSLRKGPQGIRAIADGRAETPGGVVAAVLRVQCRTKGGTSLCVSLKVEEAARIEGFELAAFEGRDAPARGQKLLHARAGDALVLEAPVEGHWARDPEDAFAFEVCGVGHGDGEAPALARAIASGAGEIELSVRNPSGDGREIRARFPSDAVDKVVSVVVERCER